MGTLVPEDSRRLHFGDVAWVVEVYDKISVDLIAEHLTRAKLFHVRQGTKDDTPLVGRDVKDALLKANAG